MLHPFEELKSEKEPCLGSNMESGLDISVFAFEIVCNCYKPIAAWGVGKKKPYISLKTIGDHSHQKFLQNHILQECFKMSPELLCSKSSSLGTRKGFGFRSWLFIFLCMKNLIPSFFHVTFIITAPSSLCPAFLKLVTINSHQMGVARILIINQFTSKMSSSL